MRKIRNKAFFIKPERVLDCSRLINQFYNETLLKRFISFHPLSAGKIGTEPYRPCTINGVEGTSVSRLFFIGRHICLICFKEVLEVKKKSYSMLRMLVLRKALSMLITTTYYDASMIKKKKNLERKQSTERKLSLNYKIIGYD